MPDLYLAVATEPRATAQQVVAVVVPLVRRRVVATAAIPRLAALEVEAARREALAAMAVLLGVLVLHLAAAGAALSAAVAPVMRAAPAAPGRSGLLM